MVKIWDDPDQTLVTYSPAGTEDYRTRIRRPSPSQNGARDTVSLALLDVLLRTARVFHFSLFVGWLIERQPGKSARKRVAAAKRMRHSKCFDR